MRIYKSSVSVINNELMVIPLIIAFLLVGCHHDPGPTPGCEGHFRAEWVNEPQREGQVLVSWFRSSSNPSAILIQVYTTAPLTGWYSGSRNQIFNAIIRRFGGNTGIRLCCGSDTVSKATIVGHGTQRDYSFDGTSSVELLSMGSVDLIQVGTWISAHCDQLLEDHRDKSVDFPISVLTTCQRSDGSEVEWETTLEYQTTSTCSHSI